MRHLGGKRAGSDNQSQQQLLLVLQQISGVLTAETDLQIILKDMATIVAKALGAKWVNFWNLTPDQKAVFIFAHYGMLPAYMEHSQRNPIPLGRALIGRTIKSGRAWSTRDILKDRTMLKELPNWQNIIKKQDYHGLLCVPLISGKTIVGGLCAYFKKPHEFTDFEMRLMTVTANQAATAITNAKIFNELLTERNKSVAIIDSLSDGLIMYDLENKIIEFNPRSEELFWISRKEIINQDYLSLPTKNQQFNNIIMISSLAIKDFESKELLIEKPQRLFFKITQMPVRDANDKKLGKMLVVHDITAEKETEELKSKFVSVVSHQLRTPLTRIKWVLAAFLAGELGEITSKQLESLEKIDEENEQMIGIIRDLLDVSRIEEGRFGYKFQLIDIFKITEQTASKFLPLAQKRNLHIIIDKPIEILPQVSSDEEKLVLAIENIIDNAVKYTSPGGKIHVSFHRGAKNLLINIKDTGIGIPRDQQKFIFTKFFRARNAILLQTEGSGLGLWIANEIIKRHNGRIDFDSEENKGSTFLIQLPLDQSRMPRGVI